MSTPGGSMPSPDPPLDFADSHLDTRRAHPTGLETMEGTSDDLSMTYESLIIGSSYPAKVNDFIDNRIQEDPMQSSSRNHFRTDAKKEILPFLRQAYLFYRNLYPDEESRLCLRMATIAFLEGPDRALKAYEDHDRLFNRLQVSTYKGMPAILYGSQNATFNNYLEYLRHIYYGRISHREDPRFDAHYEPIDLFVPSNTVAKPDPLQNVRYPFPVLYSGTGSVPQTPHNIQPPSATPRRPPSSATSASGASTPDPAHTFRPVSSPDPADLGQSFAGHRWTSMPGDDSTVGGAAGGATASGTAGATGAPGSSNPPPHPSPPHQAQQPPPPPVQPVPQSVPQPQPPPQPQPQVQPQQPQAQFQPQQQQSQQPPRRTNVFPPPPARQSLLDDPVPSQRMQTPLLSGATTSGGQPLQQPSQQPPSLTTAAPCFRFGAMGANVAADIASHFPIFPPYRPALPQPQPPPAHQQPTPQPQPVQQPHDLRISAPQPAQNLQNPQPHSQAGYDHDFDEEIRRDEFDFPDQRRGYSQHQEEVQQSSQPLNTMGLLLKLVDQMAIQNQSIKRFEDFMARAESRGIQHEGQHSSPPPRNVGFSRSQYEEEEGFRPYQSPVAETRRGVIKPQPLLPQCGRVMESSQPLRRRVPLASNIDPVAQYVQDIGLDPVTAGVVIGFSKAHRKANREARSLDFEIQTVDPFAKSTRVDSFNYNINGRTAEDILGSRFNSTYFESEGARLATMKAIFQKVVDDPYCSPLAKAIALEKLGKFDPSQEYSNNILMSTISTMGALADPTAGLLWTDDSDKVDPPLLGHLTMSDPAITKELFFHLGMQAGEKYRPGTSKRPLRFYLQGVATRITNQKLCRDSAYSLLLTLLEGDLYDEVFRMQNQGVPFEETWSYIQNCSVGQVSRETLSKELEDLYKTKPTNMFVTLSRIQELRVQQMSNIADKKKRESVVSVITQLDFRNLVGQFYGAAAATTVDNLLAHEVARHEKQRQLYERQGLPFRTSFNEVRKMKEIICTYVNQTIRPSKGPSMIYSSCLDMQMPEQISIASLNASSVPAPLTNTSIQSLNSAGSSRGSRSQKGSKRSGNGNQNGGFSAQPAPQQMTMTREQQSLLQAAQQTRHALNQKAMQAKSQFDSQPLSSYPPPDFTKLLLPIERNMTKRDRSGVPQICWNTIGTNICFLCAVKNHFYDECPLYPGQLPSEQQCHCKGFHKSECRSHLRDMMDLVVREGWNPPQPPPPRQPREGQNNGDVQYAPRNGNRPDRRNDWNGGNGNNGDYRRNNNRYNNNNGGGRSNGNDRRYDRQGRNGNGNNGNGYNNRDQGRYGYPNQQGDQGGAFQQGSGPAVEGVSPAGVSATRAGGGLGNSGNQQPPGTIFMNPAEVILKNN